jgi:hypothetical protein
MAHTRPEAQVDPEAPAVAQVDPEVPAVAQVDPEVPAAAQVDPEVPAAAQVDPEVPAAAQAEPGTRQARRRQNPGYFGRWKQEAQSLRRLQHSHSDRCSCPFRMAPLRLGDRCRAPRLAPRQARQRRPGHTQTSAG